MIDYCTKHCDHAGYAILRDGYMPDTTCDVVVNGLCFEYCAITDVDITTISKFAFECYPICFRVAALLSFQLVCG